MSAITIKRALFKRALNRTSSSRPSFRELTRGYFPRERSWEFAIEVLLFAIIVAISMWPIFAVAAALNEFLQRTAS